MKEKIKKDYKFSSEGSIVSSTLTATELMIMVQKSKET